MHYVFLGLNKMLTSTSLQMRNITNSGCPSTVFLLFIFSLSQVIMDDFQVIMEDSHVIMDSFQVIMDDFFLHLGDFRLGFISQQYDRQTNEPSIQEIP